MLTIWQIHKLLQAADMPPKKRNPEGEGKVQVKKRKKKKNNEDSDDSDSDHGAGNGATPLNNEPEDDIDIVRKH